MLKILHALKCVVFKNLDIMKSLVNLLKQIEKYEGSYELGKFQEISATWHDITEYSGNYTLSQLKERTELRRIGHREIPRKGQLIDIYDNDRSGGPKVKIPEFDSISDKKEAAVIEVVKDVFLYNRFKGQVKLVVERYLICEK